MKSSILLITLFLITTFAISTEAQDWNVKFGPYGQVSAATGNHRPLWEIGGKFAVTNPVLSKHLELDVLIGTGGIRTLEDTLHTCTLADGCSLNDLKDVFGKSHGYNAVTVHLYCPFDILGGK